MADPRDVAAEILLRAAPKEGLAGDRLVKFMYLVDWKHAIEHGEQATELQWRADSVGPFDPSIPKRLSAHPPMFRVERLRELFEDSEVMVYLSDHDYKPRLSDSEREAVEHVVKVASNKSWGQIVRLVYATYPMMSHSRYKQLDLPKLAGDYREFKRELANKKQGTTAG